MKKGGRIANRPGLVKKKIRGKDGKTRTYWVKKGQSLSSPESKMKAGMKTAISAVISARTPIGITAGLAATTMGSYLGLKIGVQNISAKEEDFLWLDNPEHQEEIKRRYSEFQPGDLLERAFPTRVGVGELVAKHYAVYVGRDPDTHEQLIVHATADSEGRPIIGLDTIESKHEGQSAFQKVEIPPPTDEQIAKGHPRSREEILLRAQAVMGLPHKYQVLRSNCESIARGIIQGEARSSQAERRDLVTQVGGRFMTLVGARKYWEPDSIDAPELTRQLNLLTLEARKDGLILREKERRVATPKEINDTLDKFKGGKIGEEMQVKILAEWLTTLASLSKKEKSRSDADSKPCPGGYRIPLKKKCRTGEEDGSSPLLARAKEVMRSVVSEPEAQGKIAGLALAAALGTPAAKNRLNALKEETTKKSKEIIRGKIKEVGEVIKHGAGDEFVEEQIDEISAAVQERLKKEVRRKVEEVQENITRPVKRAGGKLLEIDQRARTAAKNTWNRISERAGKIGRRSRKDSTLSNRILNRAKKNYREIFDDMDC